MFRMNVAKPKAKDWFGTMVAFLNSSGRSETGLQQPKSSTAAASAKGNTAAVTDPLELNNMALGFVAFCGHYHDKVKHQKAKLIKWKLLSTMWNSEAA